MKHVSCVDNLSNLHAFIRQELRELGVKVPKPKKSKRATQVQKNQETNKASIFGNYLAQVHCVHVPCCGYVAKFLVDAAEIITDNIDNEGVFRKSGAVSRQKEIKQQLENGSGFDGANVHDVTALVKQFFRELPEPLFTSMYHDTFIRCYQIEDPEVATRAILLLCLLLPSEHLSTLRFIMKLLSRITEYVESNKMDSTNLAVVLAPNIMHVNSKSETMKSCEEKMLQVQTSVVELLIKHADQVGMVDDNMVEKTALMSEVFSTDDELDASDDMLDDSRETRKKDKKRKRSGSFQGFVSSIAQSITKWRRSTDGKTNTSGISQGSQCSNNSHMSATGNTKQPEDGSYNNQVYQFTASDATPVVRRKKTVPGTEGRAFSAAKKKAILNGLPQHSALASTPFTPAAGMRKLDIQSARRGLHDTPSMPPRPYQTPRQNMKTPRKKLGLFSPASTTKKKRYSSSSNLSVNSGGKKSGKSKGIFRRLSGSKGDQAFPTEKSSSQEQIGQRLAVSPTSTRSSASVQSNSSHLSEGCKIISDESPIAAIAQNSFSSSVCEQSVISTYDDESRSLNEGFIVTEDKEGDITRIMSEPAIAGSFEAGEYVCLEDVRPRASESDTTLLSRSHETPKGHCRSFSVDSTLDGSTKKSSLSRGRPNSIKVGLLQGDQSEVQKLRRSFGLEKSDISFPLPLSVSSMSDEDQYVQLDGSFDFLKPDSNTNTDQNPDDNQDEYGVDSPGSVSRCYPSVSESSFQSNDTNQRDYECNDKSASGFSATSGGTVIKKPKKSEDDDQFKVDTEGDGKKSLAQQKQESKDSLLSEASSTISPVMLFKEREMTRSISADSGKGSMCDESRDGDVTLDSLSRSVMEIKDSPFVTNCEEESTTSGILMETRTDAEHVDITKEEVMEYMNNDPEKPSLAHKKSVSTQDLQRDIETPTRVARSKSLLESSISRRCNARPNLQISAETHKLLARAGYIREQKTDPNPGFGDFVVPTTFPFIEQPETLNPRRESIIALQKNNAGKVKSNVKQFDKFTEAELEKKHSSPFRFPNSTTRKRGTTRLRIPPVFNGPETDIDKTLTSSELLDTSKDRIMKGTAIVPISTQMIKPSDPDMKIQENSSGVSGGLKRKPSIYRANKDDAMPPSNKERRVHKILITTEELDETFNDDTNDLNMSTDKLEDSVFVASGTSGIFQGRSLDLDQSLQDNINNVCTPNSEIFAQNLHKSDKENSFNDDGNVKKMPEIKSSILTTPITLEHMAFRTASNKTPVDLFRAAVSPRSPIKPLKRLGSSPHSPRSKPVHSPKLVKTNRQSLLTALPNPNDDFDNL